MSETIVKKKDVVFRKEYMDLVEKLKKAKEEGYGEGKIDERSRLIRNVMKSGMSFENACEMLQLSEAEIRECKKYLKEY